MARILHAPTTAQDVAAIVQEAHGSGQRLAVRSLGTRDDLGHPTQADAVLSLSALTGVVDYQPSELLLTARPATPLAEIEALLAAEGQMLALEPALHTGGSLGGALAINDGGPRRFRLGAARDHLLGFEGVTGRGEPFVAGGRVVKNVTGYDLSKLVCGSFGTLAVLTEVHVKVWPAPACIATVVLRQPDPAEALASLGIAASSPHDPTGAAHVNGLTAVRVEGPERSVAHRAEALRELLGAKLVLTTEASTSFWAHVRDATFVREGSAVVWCVSLPPTHARAFLAAVEPDRFVIDQAGGRIWLGYDDAAGAGALGVRAHLGEGHATLVHAPVATKQAVPVFQPRPHALAALEQRVKHQFDPEGILEPGRLGSTR